MERGRIHGNGFTLVEALIASAVALVVVIPLAETLITCQRLMKLTMAETETSLALRELREKLLFHAAPPGNGRTYAGVLSGSGFATEGASGNFSMSYDDGGGTSYSMRFTRRSHGGSWVFCNERAQNYEGVGAAKAQDWFVLPGMSQPTAWADTVVLPEAADSRADSRFYLDLALKTKSGIVRSQRVTVPVFNKEQSEFKPK